MGRYGYSKLALKDVKEWFKDNHPYSFKKDVDGKVKRERIRVQVYFYDDELYRFKVFCVKNKLSQSEYLKKLALRDMAQQKKFKKGRLV